MNDFDWHTQDRLQRDRELDRIDRIVYALCLAVVAGLCIFAAAVHESRPETVVEPVEVPERVVERHVPQYSANTSDHPDFPWRDGYVCPSPCID